MGGGERSSTKHLLWLKVDVHHDHKLFLKCVVSSQKLVSMQNYQPAFVKGPPLADWKCTCAMELWYKKITRRPNVKDSLSAPRRPQSDEIELETE